MSADGSWFVERGSLSKPEVETLISLLASEGTEPFCWFAGWEFDAGSALFRTRAGAVGELVVRSKELWRERRNRRARARLPRIEILGQSGRRYLVYRGSLRQALVSPHGFYRSPVLWWPDDRAWLIHTELDAMSTYLGGPRALVDEMVGEQILESFEVQADTVAAL
jgi:hypothetical protein